MLESRFALALALVALGGCGGSGHKAPVGPPLVVTIVLENQDYADIIGSPNAPYLNSLVAQYGLATNYQDSGTHPSLPNYLYMISGDTQYPGGIDIDPNASYAGTDFPVMKDNLGHQLQQAGVHWRAYAEDMGTPCALLPSGNYAPKHVPFLYFDNIQNGPNGLCAEKIVDFSALEGDLAASANQYIFITPNLLDDGHNPTNDPVTGLKQADAWCQSEIPKLMATAQYQNGGIIFLTWDEAEGRNGNPLDQIPMIVISPNLVSAGFQSTTAYSHANFLATVEDLFHLPRLGAAVGVSAMTEFFK
jgi:hypothetical protein